MAAFFGGFILCLLVLVCLAGGKSFSSLEVIILQSWCEKLQYISDWSHCNRKILWDFTCILIFCIAS